MANSRSAHASDNKEPVEGKHVLAGGLDASSSSVQSTVKDIETNLGSTIYALSVRQVVLTQWHGGTWRLVSALLFTIILQLALVGLLLQVAATGNMSSTRPPHDNIWVELGRTRRELARLQDHLFPPSEVAKPSDPLPIPCVETLCQHWPFISDTTDRERTAEALFDDCSTNLCCYFLHPSCLLGINGSDDRPVNKSQVLAPNTTEILEPCHRELQLRNMTAQQWHDKFNCSVESCLFFAVSTDLPVLEFGWGLFHTTEEDQKVMICDSPGADQSSERRADEQKFAGHLHKWFHRDRYEHEPVLFAMFSYLVMLVVTFNEVRQALNLFIYSVAVSGLLPEFYTPLAAGVVPEAHGNLPWWSTAFIVAAPIVQLVVAFVLSSCGGALFLCTDMQEKRAAIIFNAVALAFILELDDRIGSIMMSQQQWMPQSGRDNASNTSAQPICSLQICSLQLSCFRISGRSSSGNSRTASTGTMVSKHRHRRNVAGYVVFAIVGLLLLAQSLLIAPQIPAQMLAFLTTSWAYIKAPYTGARTIREWTTNEGLIKGLFMDPHVRIIDYVNPSESVWTTFAFYGFPGLTTWPDSGSGVALGRVDAIWICSIYMLLAVATVLVLCHSLLPCAHKEWTLVLTAVQVALVITAQLQYTSHYQCHRKAPPGNGTAATNTTSTTMSDAASEADPTCPAKGSNITFMKVNKYGFLVVLSMLVFCWFGMFVVWPFVYSETGRACLRKSQAALCSTVALCCTVCGRAKPAPPPAAAGVREGVSQEALDSLEAGPHSGDTAITPDQPLAEFVLHLH